MKGCAVFLITVHKENSSSNQQTAVLVVTGAHSFCLQRIGIARGTALPPLDSH